MEKHIDNTASFELGHETLDLRGSGNCIEKGTEQDAILRKRTVADEVLEAGKER